MTLTKKKIIPFVAIGFVAVMSLAVLAYNSTQKQIETVFHKIEDIQIDYKEMGVTLTGIHYNDPLTGDELAEINKEIIDNLSHDLDCNAHCTDEHDVPRSTIIESEEGIKQMWSYFNEEDWNTEVNLKNQEDKNFNTYLTIKSAGTNVKMLDMLRNRSLGTFKDLKIKPNETIYFKGTIADRLSEITMETLGRQLLDNLDAKVTNIYIDDLSPTTRVYYGYTRDFKGEYVEQNGEKSNVQVGFKYNEELNQTEVIVAFPFYNDSF